MTAPIRRIGVIGAESSGKTTLALSLAQELNSVGIPAVVVPEYLRTWCEANGRTPTLLEQAEIVRGQIEAEDRIAAENPGAVLVCDPAALMTALYSHLYFDQPIEIDPEIAQRYSDLVWCDIDIDWEPDPLRDGEHFRIRMHEVISAHQDPLRRASGADMYLVSGAVHERVHRALATGFGRRGNPISP